MLLVSLGYYSSLMMATVSDQNMYDRKNWLCAVVGNKISVWQVTFVTCCEHLSGKNCCRPSLINVSFGVSLDDFIIAEGNNNALNLFFSLYSISPQSSAHVCSILPKCQV
jgi:hypothetical protein